MSRFSQFPATSRQEWHYRAAPGGWSRLSVLVALRLRDCDPRSLQLALDDLVARHEALRTTLLVSSSNEVRQVVHRRGRLRIQPASPPEATSDEDRWRAVMRQAAEEPFDVHGGALTRARLCRLGAAEHVLVLAAHHAVADGWSRRVLYRDLVALYRARCEGSEVDLPDLDLQLVDYADREQELAAQDVSGYWRERVSAGAAEIRVGSGEAAVEGQFSMCALPVISATTMERIRRVARAQRVAESRVLWAGVLAALSPLCTGPEVTVGLMVSNRERPELRQVVGELSGLVPIRVDLSGDPSLGELAVRMDEAVGGALAHQVPFEVLVDVMRRNRQRSSGPLLDLVLDYLPHPRQRASLAASAATWHSRVVEVEPPPELLRFKVSRWWEALGHVDVQHRPRADGGVGGQLLMNVATVSRATITRLTVGLMAIVEAASWDPRTQLSSLAGQLGEEL